MMVDLTPTLLPSSRLVRMDLTGDLLVKLLARYAVKVNLAFCSTGLEPFLKTRQVENLEMF